MQSFKYKSHKANVVDNLMEQIEQEHGYQIVKNIGCGSFGNVFKVKSVDTGHHFAMKVYKNPFKSAYSCR